MSYLIGSEKKERLEDTIGLEENLVKRTKSGETGLDLAGMFDESKLKRYQEAMEKKAILLDKEDSEGIDYTHMDFILSTGCGFYRGMTNLVAVQLFWKAFYPYLKKIIESYENFYHRFRDMIDDQEEVLRNHAELDYKYKWTVEYIEACGHKEKYNKYIRQQIAEIKKNQKHDKVMPSEELPNLIID